LGPTGGTTDSQCRLALRRRFAATNEKIAAVNKRCPGRLPQLAPPGNRAFLRVRLDGAWHQLRYVQPSSYTLAADEEPIQCQADAMHQLLATMARSEMDTAIADRCGSSRSAVA
jgi:hypothetical protein